MRKKEEKYLDKGIYDHPQVSGYLSLRQFIMVEQDGKRCVLLRFSNEAPFEINDVEFMLKQLDSRGETVDVVKVRYKGLHIGAGTMYAPSKGIVVKKECVDFVIQMRYVVSDQYKYVFKNGQVTPRYDTRGYADPPKYRKTKRSGVDSADIKNRYSGGGKFYGFIAFITFVLIIGMLALIMFKVGGTARPDVLTDVSNSSENLTFLTE